jgi:acyl transferase domain-containing protein
MSGRWPGAANVSEFWSNLCGGVESIRGRSEEEIAAAGFDPAILKQPNFVNAGGLIENGDMFDAAFFGITAREAQSLDPQRRVFLECAWHALEDAGYVPEQMDGPAGLFAGSSLNGYLQRVQADHELVAAVGAYQTLIGNDKDHLTTYTAYKLNLTGPAVTVQTACSTSLVAVSMACQSLLNQECDLALAGGVSIRWPQHFGYFYEEGGVLSPDGHCRPFDAAAKGTVGGSGVGIVVLKRLEDAVRDRDAIHAVILGSAINNDGAAKAGYTAPSVEGQASVVATALALAGVEPETLGYIEAHGTATPLGDPIEIAGLVQAFGETGRRGFCAIGSVKSNIGHLDAAAGVSGLIKAACCLEQGLVPPSLYYERPNPAIDFAASPFYVADRLAPWSSHETPSNETPSNGTPRRAGVSAFGIGGTNAHAVLEQPPARPDSGPSRSHQLLVVSARSSEALEKLTDEIRADLTLDAARPLADVAYTLAFGRRAMPHRGYLVLGPGASEWSGSGVAMERAAPVFLFPGQGSQHAGMGRDLYQREAVFRAEFDRCATLLKPHLGLDLRIALFAADASDERLRQTALAQPALFAIEYSLARLVMSWGISPAAMIGHSLGEYVAACLAGVFSLEDALTIVAMRGMLMQDTAPGAMLAASIAEEDALAILPPEIEIAAVNGPSQTVFSGPEEAITQFAGSLNAREIPCVRLRTSHAFHSRTMDAALAIFGSLLQPIAMRAPAIPYIANLTGDWQTSAAADPKYWIAHGRNAVRFGAGCGALLEAGHRIFLEIGPGATLSRLLEPHLRTEPQLAGDGVIAQTGGDQRALLQAVGQLWSHGVAVDWRKYFGSEARNRVRLPLYPFEWQRYDVEAPAEASRIDWTAKKNPDIATWLYEPTWKATAPAPQSGVLLPGSTLLFLDDSGLGAAVARQLSKVVTVARGEAFAQVGPAAFQIRPEEAADYDALLTALWATDATPLATHGTAARILHFWNVDRAPADPGRVFYPLLSLAQALARIGSAAPVNVISSGAWAVTGDEAIEPAKAMLAGICRIAPMEHPGMRWRNIDVAPGEHTAGQIVAECGAETLDPIVAYRGRRRWTESAEPLPTSTDRSLTLLRPRGVYLITGGLSGIGWTLAGFLAREYQARLILVSRSADTKQAEIAELEAAGAEVLACAADVSDRAQMRAALERAQARFGAGAIHGVIHSAGIAGGGLIQLKDPASADAVFAAKVQGTLVLDELLRGGLPGGDLLKSPALDFFVCCSSLTSLLGGVGQVDYCSANAFLDAYAQCAAGRGARRTISIQWDAWAEVGMAVNTPVPAGLEAQRAAMQQYAMLPAEGVEAFLRALASGVPQVSISTLSLPWRMAQSRLMPAQHAVTGATSMARAGKRHPRPALRTEYAAPATDMERLVAAIWQDLFGIDEVGIHDDFFDLGGHSLMATQLASRIRGALGKEMAVRHIFEAPTVAQLAAALELITGDPDDLARALASIEEMTDEEVRTQLERS